MIKTEAMSPCALKIVPSEKLKTTRGGGSSATSRGLTVARRSASAFAVTTASGRNVVAPARKANHWIPPEADLHVPIEFSRLMC